MGKELHDPGEVTWIPCQSLERPQEIGVVRCAERTSILNKQGHDGAVAPGRLRIDGVKEYLRCGFGQSL